MLNVRARIPHRAGEHDKRGFNSHRGRMEDNARIKDFVILTPRNAEVGKAVCMLKEQSIFGSKPIDTALTFGWVSFPKCKSNQTITATTGTGTTTGTEKICTREHIAFFQLLPGLHPVTSIPAHAAWWEINEYFIENQLQYGNRAYGESGLRINGQNNRPKWLPQKARVDARVLRVGYEF